MSHHGWPPHFGHVGPSIYGPEVPPTPGDTKNAPARIAAGFTADCNISDGAVTQVAQHTSPQPRVVRVQPRTLYQRLQGQWSVEVVITHGVDAGVEIARAPLVAWGVAFQVPAGEVKVSVNVASLNQQAQQAPEIYPVVVSMADGFLRERVASFSVSLSNIPPAYLSLPLLLEPPPFAVEQTCSAMAGGQWKFQEVGTVGWTQLLDSTATVPTPNQYVEAKMAAQAIQAVGWGNQGLCEVRWRIIE
jgi:hypothetical protein